MLDVSEDRFCVKAPLLSFFHSFFWYKSFVCLLLQSVQVVIDLDNPVYFLIMAIRSKRTTGAFVSLVKIQCLHKACSRSPNGRIYIFHWFAWRANTLVIVLVIGKFVSCIRLFIPYRFILIAVKMAMFYISCNPLFFEPLIILFTAVTCVSSYTGRFLMIVFNKLLQVLC